MAPHFPPVVLKNNEIMMNEEIFDFMQASVGSKLKVTVNIGAFLPSLNEGYANLWAMMSSSMESGPKFDWRKRTMTINGNSTSPEQEIPFDHAFKLGAPDIPEVINITSELK